MIKDRVRIRRQGPSKDLGELELRAAVFAELTTGSMGEFVNVCWRLWYLNKSWISYSIFHIQCIPIRRKSLPPLRREYAEHRHGWAQMPTPCWCLCEPRGLRVLFWASVCAPFRKLPWWLRREGIHLHCRILGFDPWVGKSPWRRAWQHFPVFLPGESPRAEEPGRLKYMGSQSRRQLGNWAQSTTNEIQKGRNMYIHVADTLPSFRN